MQDYSTVEQPCVCLLHCCGITLLILPSQETYREETKAMLPHVATKLHGPLLCSSGFPLWVGHRHFIASAIIFSRKWLVWIVSQTLEWHLPLPVWCCSCITLGKSIPLSVWATTSNGCFLNPNLGQSLLLFSALNSFLHCLFLSPETIHIVWLGFA